MKNLLTIAGSDCSGGAGIQADLKTFAAHGTFGMSVIVSVVAENTARVIDIQDVTPDMIKKQMDAVFEDIFPDAVKIGMLCNEEIIEAARRSHSWEFIRRLPNGLDTRLKEDSLSQGEKQLLCITRVMLCLPPMLILDEATSSIDTRTELMVQEAFDRLMEGRTSFIVAHRLSTIRNADEILVMKAGSIVEQGSHDELMAKGGFYQNLYNSQFVKVAE